MKTLTEFSGTLVRMAAKAAAEARKKLPKEAFAARVPSPEPETRPEVEPHDNKNEAAPEVGVDSVTEAADEELAKDAVSHVPASAQPKPHEFQPGEAETPSDRETHEDPDTEFRKEEKVAGQDLSGQAQDGPPAEDTEAEARPPPRVEPEEAETEQAKAALDEAVSKATGTTGERLDRLRDALKAVGNQADRVRLVRVFPPDESVPGAKKIGEFQYVVDLMPQSMKQEFRRDEKGRPRGPRRPSGGKQKGDTLEGSFSMESV
ncbi:MAG TPA: hypothetical protein VG496_10250, partial [Myxococcales bacterium]|nr:hypothetical protein [Myxococcales bacterium]